MYLHDDKDKKVYLRFLLMFLMNDYWLEQQPFMLKCQILNSETQNHQMVLVMKMFHIKETLHHVNLRVALQ